MIASKRTRNFILKQALKFLRESNLYELLPYSKTRLWNQAEIESDLRYCIALDQTEANFLFSELCNEQLIHPVKLKRNLKYYLVPLGRETKEELHQRALQIPHRFSSFTSNPQSVVAEVRAEIMKNESGGFKEYQAILDCLKGYLFEYHVQKPTAVGVLKMLLTDKAIVRFDTAAGDLYYICSQNEYQHGICKDALRRIEEKRRQAKRNLEQQRYENLKDQFYEQAEFKKALNNFDKQIKALQDNKNTPLEDVIALKLKKMEFERSSEKTMLRVTNQTLRNKRIMNF